MIRPATIQDAESIAKIHIDAWKFAYSGIVPDAYLERLDLGVKTQRWEDILKESQSETFVMEYAGQVTSWISYGNSRDHDGEGLGEVWALYVSPELLRHGHGRSLMQYVEEIARGAKIPSLVLWVLEKNVRGRSFYEKVGYAPMEQLKQLK